MQWKIGWWGHVLRKMSQIAILLTQIVTLIMSEIVDKKAHTPYRMAFLKLSNNRIMLWGTETHPAMVVTRSNDETDFT